MPALSLAQEARLRNILEGLNGRNLEWTPDELAAHLLSSYVRMKPRTVEKRMAALQRMARHPLKPVNTHGTAEELFFSFVAFVQHREEVERKSPQALSEDYKAIKTLSKFRGIPNEIWPKPPTIPEKPKELRQSPEDIHDLLHAKYVPNAKNSYEQHLIQYLLVYDFGFGPRMPSEAYTLRVDDFQPDQHLLTITESKKSMRRRRLLVEPEWLCCSAAHPSLAQYARRWRPKVDAGESDAFWLKPNGQPFPSPDAIRVYLEGKVKPLFPWYHGYLGRTWNVNARLVAWNFDYARVADWTGHASVDMVRSAYEKDARIHARLYGGQWLERAFRKPKSAQRTLNGSRTPLPPAVSPGKGDAPAEIRTRV